jgi:hypothetical protein
LFLSSGFSVLHLGQVIVAISFTSAYCSNLAELEDRLSPAAAAAKERGRARDLQAIVEEIMAKL